MPLVTIQYARAVAALMVVAFHLPLQLERMGYDTVAAPWLAGGVDIFFVISGFIMWWTTRDAEQSPGAFMGRRLLRIAPLYWAITTFYVVVLLIAPQLLQSAELDLPHVVSSYLFLPYPHPVIEALQPLVVPGWTLNFEMFFYLVFAAVLVTPRDTRLATLGLVLVGLVALGFVADPGGRFLETYTSTLLLEFLFGALVAELARRGVLAPLSLVLPAATLGFLALSMLGEFGAHRMRGLIWGLPSALIIFAFVSAELRGWVPRLPGLRFIGDASYSIYLTHPLALSALGQGWRRIIVEPSMPAFAGFIASGVLATVAIGCLCYRFVESPTNRLARRMFDPGHALASSGRGA